MSLVWVASILWLALVPLSTSEVPPLPTTPSLVHITASLGNGSAIVYPFGVCGDPNGYDAVTNATYPSSRCNMQAVFQKYSPGAPGYNVSLYDLFGTTTLRIEIDPGVSLVQVPFTVTPVGANLEIIGRDSPTAGPRPILEPVSEGYSFLSLTRGNTTVTIKGVEIRHFAADVGPVLSLFPTNFTTDHFLTIILDDCYIHSNRADQGGGVIGGKDSTGGDLHLQATDCVFDNNTVWSSGPPVATPADVRYGGGIVMVRNFRNVYVAVERCNMTNHRVAPQPAFQHGPRMGSGRGGLFWLDSGAVGFSQPIDAPRITMVLDACRIEGNAIDSLFLNTTGTILPTHVCGGAIVFIETSRIGSGLGYAKAIIRNTSMTQNTVQGSGSVIHGLIRVHQILNIVVDIGMGSTMTENLVESRAKDSGVTKVSGALVSAQSPLLGAATYSGVHVTVDDLTMMNNRVIANQSVIGGFVHVFGGIATTPVVTMRNSRVEGNLVVSDGLLLGGIVGATGTFGGYFTFVLEDNRVVDNVVASQRALWGGIFGTLIMHSITMTFMNNLYQGNNITAAAMVKGMNFAQVAGPLDFVAIGNRFVENHVEGQGSAPAHGLVYSFSMVTCDLTLRDEVVTDNVLVSANGAATGLFLYANSTDANALGAGRALTGSLVMEDVVVERNVQSGALPGGGGLVAFQGLIGDVHMSLVRDMFAHNAVDRDCRGMCAPFGGSMVYVEASSRVILDRVTFWNNSAVSVNGSLVYVHAPSPVVEELWSVLVRDCFFDANTSARPVLADSEVFVDASLSLAASGLVSVIDTSVGSWMGAGRVMGISDETRVAHRDSCADEAPCATGFGCAPHPFGSFGFGVLCSQCIPGAGLTTANICQLCRPGFHNSGSGSSTCIPCPTGSFSITFGANQCATCPKPGGFCEGGGVVAVPGYWVPVTSNISNAQVDAYRCLPGSCVGANQCGENRVPFADNPLCRLCQAGYVAMGGECVYCPAVNAGVMVVLVLALVVFVLVVHATSQTTTGLTRILFFYVQTALVMIASTSAAQVQWLEAFNSPLLAVKTCVGPFDDYFRLASSTLTPIAGIFILGLFAAGERCWKAHRKVPFDTTQYKRSLMALGFFSYTQLLLVSTRALRCVEVQTTGSETRFFVATMPGIDCEEAAYKTWRVLFLTVLVTSVVVPVVLGHMLYVRRDSIRANLRGDDVGKKGPWYGYAYEPFRPAAYNFQVIILLKRFAFIAVDLLLALRPEDRGFAFQCVIIAALSYQAYVLPFRLQVENFLDIVAHGLLLLQSSILMGREPPYDDHVLRLVGLFTALPVLSIVVVYGLQSLVMVIKWRGKGVKDKDAQETWWMRYLALVAEPTRVRRTGTLQLFTGTKAKE